VGLYHQFDDINLFVDTEDCVDHVNGWLHKYSDEKRVPRVAYVKLNVFYLFFILIFLKT
jgi:hypothetical protein